MQQLAMDIALPACFSQENFFIASANQLAYNYIQQWPTWPHCHALCVTGPRYSGKTHLATIWAQRAQATWLNARDLDIDHILAIPAAHCRFVIDDVHLWHNELLLLTVFNFTKENQGSLLITATKPLQECSLTLPDLSSRFNSIPQLSILAPDDDLIQAILIKRFSDIQIKVSQVILSYLSQHIERSYRSINETVDTLNRLSLTQKRNLTLPFVRQILSQAL